MHDVIICACANMPLNTSWFANLDCGALSSANFSSSFVDIARKKKNSQVNMSAGAGLMKVGVVNHVTSSNCCAWLQHVMRMQSKWTD